MRFERNSSRHFYREWRLTKIGKYNSITYSQVTLFYWRIKTWVVETEVLQNVFPGQDTLIRDVEGKVVRKDGSKTLLFRPIQKLVIILPKIEPI